MTLTNATLHFMKLENGERIKYLRLQYRIGCISTGRSVLASRFRPKFVAQIQTVQ